VPCESLIPALVVIDMPDRHCVTAQGHLTVGGHFFTR
jgi:hypothetical protein